MIQPNTSNRLADLQPIPKAQQEHNFREIKKASRMESAGTVLSVLLVLMLAGLLGARCASSGAPGNRTDRPSRVAKRANRRPSKKTGTKPPKKETACCKPSTPEGKDPEEIGLRMRNTVRALNDAETQLKDANQKLINAHKDIVDSRKNFQGVPEYIANVEKVSKKLSEDATKRGNGLTRRTRTKEKRSR